MQEQVNIKIPLVSPSLNPMSNNPEQNHFNWSKGKRGGRRGSGPPPTDHGNSADQHIRPGRNQERVRMAWSTQPTAPPRILLTRSRRCRRRFRAGWEGSNRSSEEDDGNHLTSQRQSMGALPRAASGDGWERRRLAGSRSHQHLEGAPISFHIRRRGHRKSCSSPPPSGPSTNIRFVASHSRSPDPKNSEKLWGRL